MTVKLTYFDFNGGRGEDCRLALHIAGLDFVDERVQGKDWPGLKAETPWHNLPVLEVNGKRLGQSNAILTFIGRGHGLHPADPWEAAQHEAVLNASEELRSMLSPTLRGMSDEEKKAAREALAGDYIQRWGANVEALLGDGPFLSGGSLNVADLKLFVVMRWFKGGALDHISRDVFGAFPKLNTLYDAVAAHPGVVEWYANH